MVLESQGEYHSQWAAICSIAPKIGCTPETLRVWVRQHDQHREQLWRWIFQRHVTVTEFHLAGTGTDSGLS
ncbi:hypothetical protein ACRWYO_24825, partial [Escherichia coli]